MKKRFIKKISSKALAVAVGAAVAVQAYAPTLASAADETKYISEVYLSYGNTPKEAKDWLEKNGYTVLDQDLNEDAAGGISWLGINFSDKRSVYLGYKTTADGSQAITDLRAMNMNGDYSYDEYEKVLETKKSEINSFINSMKTALSEYRENYKKGAVKAKVAHDKLNQLIDDDSGYSALGDLLLKPVKEEMTDEEYAKAPDEHVDMTTLLMQGNIGLVNSMMSDLSLALDTAEESWLTRLKNSGGIDAMIDSYEKEYPTLSESQILSVIRSEYDDQARELAEQLDDLSEDLKVYTQSSVKANSTEKEITDYFSQNPDVTPADWTAAGLQYQIIGDTSGEEVPLDDIIAGIKYNLDNADDRMTVYPILDAMSEGQRALLSYVDMGEMLMIGNLDAEGWQKTAEETAAALKGSQPVSVYSDIDRSMFDPAGVALTSEARKIQSATGSAYTNRLLGIDTAYIQYAALGTGVILLGAGIGSFIHAEGLRKAAEEAKRLADQARSLKSTMASAEEKAADAFYKYLLKKGINSFDNIPVVEAQEFQYAEGNILKIYRKAICSSEQHKDVWYAKDNIVKLDDPTEMLNDARKDADFAKIFEEYDKTVENVKSFNADEKIKTADSVAEKFLPWEKAGTVLCIAAGLIAIGMAAVTVYDIYKYYHRDYAPIPRMIVHESTDDKGRYVYTMYNCTLCNRDAQGFGKADLGAYGDMNGDVGKQWLALYTTKDKAAGDPITADIIAQKGSNKVPTDKGTGIRLFGKNDTVNLVSTDYCYNDKLGGLYIFSGTVKTDEKPAETPAEKTDPSSAAADTSSTAESAPDTSEAGDSSSSAAAATDDTSSESDEKATGSVVGTGTMVASCAGSAALGALICFLIARRRKESAA